MTELWSIWSNSQLWVVVGLITGAFTVGMGLGHPDRILSTIYSALGGGLLTSAFILELIRGKGNVDSSGELRT